MKTSPTSIALLGHALAAWALSVATAALVQALLPLPAALVIHALAAPVFFAALAWAFHRAPDRPRPLPTALGFVLVTLLLDVLLQHRPRSLDSLAGLWLPLVLSFLGAWVAGAVTRPRERVLEASVHIEVPPARVFDWLRALPEHYREWHPDHRSARWEKGAGLERGAVLAAAELLHGKPHLVRSRLVSVEPGTDVSFVNLWPTSLVSPGGSFHLEPEGEGCLFTQTLRVRWPGLWSRLTPRRAEQLARHLREEGESLKRLLEARA